MFWRDLHAVTGFWISGLVLVLLATGLPWAGLWGSAFKAARTEMGWVAGPQTWTLGGEAPSSAGGDIHAAHDHAAMMQAMRSEEHTSELQSLMRISYAVFCLKKKLQNNIDNNTSRTNKYTKRKSVQNRQKQST